MSFGYDNNVHWPERARVMIGQHVVALVNDGDTGLATQHLFTVKIVRHINFKQAFALRVAFVQLKKAKLLAHI